DRPIYTWRKPTTRGFECHRFRDFSSPESSPASDGSCGGPAVNSAGQRASSRLGGGV
ncbi:hypothetical protein PanWU01x14_175240, partial [Parasponia andersonii]